jgi:hypothetical protein
MKAIEGFKDYFVDEKGIIYSRKFHHSKNKNLELRQISPSITNRGYLMVGFYSKGKAIGKLIHRLVAEAFIPNLENKPNVNHINGIQSDNRVENLEWCTQKENVDHAFKIGLQLTGEKHHATKLSDYQKKLIVLDVRVHREIASDYKVSQSTISLIKSKNKISQS